MYAGKLKHKISFYTINKTADGAGGNTATTSLYYTTMANVKPFTSRSALTIEGNKLSVLDALEFRFRYRPDKTITANMQLQFNGKSMIIQLIENVDSSNREIKIIATNKN
jgi:SPP1 family predicted phage head-tail adaptor